MTTKQPSPRIAFTTLIKCSKCGVDYLAKWVVSMDTPISDLPMTRYSNCDQCGQCHTHKVDLSVIATHAVESIAV